MAALTGGTWKLDTKGKLSYVLDETNVTVVTITGLSNLTTGEDGVVKVLVGSKQEDVDDYITIDEPKAIEGTKNGETVTTGYTGIVTLDADVLGTAKVSIANGKYDNLTFNATLELDSTKLVAIETTEAEEGEEKVSTETLTYNKAKGEAYITANLTAGYVVAADKKSATYSDRAINVTLATISGLQKNATDYETTMTLSGAAQNDNEGAITLSKLADDAEEGAVGVLGTSVIEITKNTKNVPFANNLSYTLALGDDYEQIAEKPYWELGKKNSATYKFETPTGYVFSEDGTKINVQKAFTTVIATVSGLNADAVVGKDDKGNSAIGVEVEEKDPEDETKTITTFVKGLEITEEESVISTTISDSGVLPKAKGTFAVAAAKNYTLSEDGITSEGVTDFVQIDTPSKEVTMQYLTDNNEELFQNIWVIKGNTATYKKVRLAYYDTSVENKITYVPQADVITLITVTGLDAEALAENANYQTVQGSEVITSITGLEFTGTGPDASYENKGTDAKPSYKWVVDTTSTDTLTIGEVDETTDTYTDYGLLGGKNITIGKSDNVRLAIDATKAPTFENQKWNLSGTTATLKGNINAGYTASDDGRSIVYTADATNAQLAKITGLKKGTYLQVSTVGEEGKEGYDDDVRTIGYNSGTDGAFVQGVEHSTSTLSYAENVDDTTGTKKLDKLDITISANVLDTSKVALTSTFYELALDEGETKGGAVVQKPDEEAVKYFIVSGTTATYKQATSRPYYTLNNGTSITYTKEVNPITLATIKGISANANVNIYGEGSNESDDNDIYINDGGVITIKKNALNDSTITVTKGTKNIPEAEKDADYTLALGSDVTEASYLKWSQSGNTVYLKAGTGYEVSGDGKSIAYTKTGGATTIAQITGLRTDIFTTETDAFKTDGSTTSVNSAVSDLGIVLDKDAGTITLDKRVLNEATVALSGTGNYTLEADTDTDNAVPTAAEEGENRWVLSKDTATFKAVNTSYYDTEKKANTLTFVAATNAAEPVNYVTISGIATDLVADPDDPTVLGYYTTETDTDDTDATGSGNVDADSSDETETTEPTFKPAIKISIDDEDAPVVTIVDSHALAGKNVTINTKGTNSKAGATLTLDTEEVADVIKPVLDGSASWSISKGTATYKGKIKAYYSNQSDKNNKTILFHKEAPSAAIATITGLNTSLTANDLNNEETGLTFGTEDLANEITIRNSMLAGKNVTLTTGVPLKGENYKLVLDDDVTTYDDDLEDGTSKHEGWSIVDNKKTGSTATYGEYTDEYYDIDDEGTTITYKAAGFNKEFAKLSGDGLKSGLVTIKDDLLSEIEVTNSGNTYTFTMTADAIVDGKNVKLEILDDAGENTYTMAIDSSINTFKTDSYDNYFCTVSGDNGATKIVTVYGAKDAGYTIEEAVGETPQTLKYNAKVTGTNDEVYGTITGLPSDVKEDSDGRIDGIEVDIESKKITLTDALLPQSTVTFSSNKGYTLAYKGIAPGTGEAYRLNSDGDLEIYAGVKIGGHTLSGNKITYEAGGTLGLTPTLKISGLKNLKSSSNAMKAGITENTVDGISIDENKVITLSKNVLDTDEVKIISGTGYTLALDKETVTETTSTDDWSFDQSKGVATFTQAITEGYKVGSDNQSVTYTAAKTVTSTLNNLSKENLSESDLGKDDDTNKKIVFADGVFTVNDKDALANKDVTLTVKSSVKSDVPAYTIALSTDVAATKEDYVWTKAEGDTKATLTQVTKSGYSLSSDSKKITYSSDPTTATLATISGLNKNIAAKENTETKEEGTDYYATTIDGISVEGSVITISKDGVLTTGNVTLGKNDKYTFALGDNVTKKISSTKGFAAVKGGLAYKDINSAYYSTDTTGKTITYNKSTASGDASFTITGLNANAVPDATGQIKGISVSDNVVTLSSNVLGTNAKTPITISGGDYTLKLADGIATAKADDVTEWVASGSNYIYRTYTKDYYTVAEDKKSIKYTAPVTNKNNDFITISGLAADKVDELKAASSGITTAEGTITLSSDLLDSKQVKLTTKGSHTLELDSTDTDITESTITTTGTGEGWSTNKTTATLKGTIGAGYAVNEAGNVVNYYSTDKSGQTIATISGLKSGATIDATYDVETGDDGYTTVTLDKDQLATSKVTIKGDFYKLNVANDAASQTDDAKWIKADGKTNATYTQTTYKGFSPSADGKTLTYLSKTTNVNLASVSGLNKDLSLDDMAVNGSINGEAATNPLLNIDDDTKIITFNSKSALNLGNVTLGKNDTYKLAFSADSIFATETVADHLTFNKGTANIMSGTSASWTKTNDKLLTYTAAKETVVSAITGLSKNLTYDSTTSSIQGISLNGDDSIVMGNSAVEGTTSIKLDNKTNDKKYKFVFASSGSDSLEEYDSASSTADTKRWDLTSTALTLKGVKSEGYSLTDSLISYNAASVTGDLAVITGISNKLFKKDSAGEIVVSKTGEQAISLSGGTGIAFTEDFKEAIKGTSVTMSITSGNYTFATGNTPSVIPASKGLIGTNISLNGTATIQKTNPEGWIFEGQNPKVISYTPGGTTTYVTINGLNKEYTVGNGGTSFKFDNSSGSITAGQSVLGASNVTMSRPKGSSTVESFKFVLGSDVNSSQNDSTKDNWKNQTEWVTSNGTASYKLYDKANYYLKDDTKNNLNSIIYVAPTKGTQFAAISGMAKGATLDSTAGVSGGTITLGKNQLEGITKAVTLKVTTAGQVSANAKKGISNEDAAAANTFIDAGNSIAGEFKLALDSEIQDSLSTAKDAVWDTNGTKAVLTGTITKGYAISTDQKTITYNTADKAGQTIAQITGLKSGSEITKDDVSIAETLSSGALSTTISLGADHLGTSNVVISKGEGYKFEFVDEVVTAEEEDQWKDQSEWVASKGTFVYKTYNKAYWELKNAETTAIYHKPVDENPAKVEGSKHKTFVTIKGLTTGITGSTDSIGAATSTSGGAQVRNGDGVITLTADVLNKAKVTLTDNIGYGYSLALGDDVNNKSDVSATVAAVATSKGVTSVTWTGTRGVGYHVANDGQSVEYFSAAKAKQTVAQVSGLKSEVTKDDIEGSYNSSSNIVTLSGNSLTSAVGISGTAEFSFDADFKDGTITGSKAADKVSIAGGGVSINAGAGNDYVSFASSGSRDANTFLYASGNGNDVVANFAASDTIKITNHKAKTAVSAKVDNGDVVVTVDKGSIRLKGLTSDSGLNIVNSAGTAIDYAKETSTSNVLADDNFATTPQLSSIVKASASTYSTEDLVATDATSLTKQSSAIAYSGSSKK